MKVGPLCRFVHRFAWRDLLDPGARRSTRVNSASMALVTALTLASVGLALGTTEIKRADLTKDRLTLCLFVGDKTIAERVDKPLAERLDAALRKAPTRKGYLGGYPFHVRTYSWLRTGVVEGGSWERITGRTIVPGDEVLDSRKPLLAGTPFARPDQDGIIVSRSMLETLGLSAAPPPTELVMELSGGEEKINLVGVFEKDLPNNQKFLMTEAYYDRLRQIEAGLVADSLETGPVPAAWPAFKDLPPAASATITDKLNRLGINDPPRELRATKDRPRTWVLKSDPANPPTRQNWLLLLKMIQDIMGSQDAEFADPRKIRLFDSEPRPVDPAEKKAAAQWEMMGFYFNEVATLPIAADVITRETVLPVHKEVIDRLEGFDRASSKALLSCLIGALVLLASSCANLKVIQELRSELKLGEIGMLKAMGMSSGLLSGIFLYEATLVWAVGTVAGLAMGFGLGALLSWLFIASPGIPSEVLVGFWCPWYIWLLPLITGPTFLFSAFWGIRRVRRSPPIETLKSS